MTSSKKLIRHRSLKKLLRDNPFSTDEQLAKMLDVSVQTIRLDRVALGIPELRGMPNSRPMRISAPENISISVCRPASRSCRVE